VYRYVSAEIRSLKNDLLRMQGLLDDADARDKNAVGLCTLNQVYP
jgi:hypothetical protein